MQYQGGKTRLAKDIARVIAEHSIYDDYLEPFVGGGSVLAAICATKRFKTHTASDIHQALITMWKALQEGWIPPDTISEQQYRYYQRTKDPLDPMTAFVGFGCSFGGAYFGGYAKNHLEGYEHLIRKDLPLGYKGINVGNYVTHAKELLIAKIASMQLVSFYWARYQDYNPVGCVIYCDPPYKGMRKYGLEFNHNIFWNLMCEWSKLNQVFVSEIDCSIDNDVVYRKQHNVSLTNTKTRGERRIEKLFLIKS